MEGVILQSFTAAQGSTGTWTPDSGQGTAYNLAGTGSVAGSTSTSTTTTAQLVPQAVPQQQVVETQLLI